MPTYTVTLSVYYTYEVDADSPREAEHRVYTGWEDLTPSDTNAKEAYTVDPATGRILNDESTDN